MPSSHVQSQKSQVVENAFVSVPSAWCPLSEIVSGIVSQIEVEVAIVALKSCDLPKAA
jgi:hypothetical protein